MSVRGKSFKEKMSYEMKVLQEFIKKTYNNVAEFSRIVKIFIFK